MRVMRAGLGKDYKVRNRLKGHSVHEWTVVWNWAWNLTDIIPAIFSSSQWSYFNFCTFNSPEEEPSELKFLANRNHGIRVTYVTSRRRIRTPESPKGPGSRGLITFRGLHHCHPLFLCCSDTGDELWEENPGTANGHFKKLKQEQLFRTLSTLALMAQMELPYNSVNSVHVCELMLRVSAEETQQRIELISPSCWRDSMNGFRMHPRSHHSCGRSAGSSNNIIQQ